MMFTMPLFVGAYVSPGKPVGFVNDFAGMMSYEARMTLESRLFDFQKSTCNEITVVTIPSLQSEGIENFAVSLFR